MTQMLPCLLQCNAGVTVDVKQSLYVGGENSATFLTHYVIICQLSTAYIFIRRCESVSN